MRDTEDDDNDQVDVSAHDEVDLRGDRAIVGHVVVGRPPPRAAEIPREDLLAVHAPHTDRRAVLISAPAGYGKSIFAAQWCAVDPDRRSVWLSLTEADDDPAAFALHLLAGLDRLEALSDGAVDALGRTLASAPRTAAATLARLAEERTPFLLVLDDVHRLESDASTALLGALIDELPPGNQVLMATRSDPAIGLARRRANGELLEIRTDQLAMDLDLTHRFLEAAGARLRPDRVIELHRRTEGWPAGLGLAAQAHSGRSAASHLTSAVSGEQREIADYFFEEVLDRQDPDLRRFLLQSSVVDRFCVALCDAMLETVTSRSMLNRLEETNLFLVALDNHRGWYRYHHLFQDMLRAELDRTEPEARRRLLGRGAAWHEEHGTTAEAMVYAQQSGDLAMAGRLVLGHWQDFGSRGQIETLRRWVTRSTDEEIATDPGLAIGAGWVYAMLGDVDRAERHAAAAAAHPLDGPSPDGATSLRSALANLRSGLGSGGIDQMLTDGLLVQAAERPSRTRWLPAGCRAVGTAHLMLGNVDAAVDALSEAVLLTESRDESRSVRIFCLGYLALAHLERGEVRQAESLVADATRGIAVDAIANTFQSLPVHSARTAVLMRTGDRSSASQAVVQTAQMLDVAQATPWMMADLSVRCAEAALEVGDRETAMDLLGRAHRALARLPDAGTIPERLASLDHRALHTDPRLETLSPAESRILRLLPSHRTLGEIGDELYISRSTVKSHVSHIYSKLGVTSRAEAVAIMGSGVTPTQLA